jgi:hypothetical protein
MCKCKQIKKKINSLEQHAKRFQRPSPWQALGIQHVRVCCGGNVERGEEENCAVRLRLKGTMLQRLALQSITDKTSPTHTLNTKQNQEGCQPRRNPGLDGAGDFD